MRPSSCTVSLRAALMALGTVRLQRDTRLDSGAVDALWQIVAGTSYVRSMALHARRLIVDGVLLATSLDKRMANR